MVSAGRQVRLLVTSVGLANAVFLSVTAAMYATGDGTPNVFGSNIYLVRDFTKPELRLLIDFIRSAPCREAKYAWLCYNTANTVARKMYASVGFEEVPEAYDEDDDEMPAVLKL